MGNRVDSLSTRIILVLWPFISQTCKLVSSFGALTRLLASVEYMRSSRVERICKGLSVQCAAKEEELEASLNFVRNLISVIATFVLTTTASFR